MYLLSAVFHNLGTEFTIFLASLTSFALFGMFIKFFIGVVRH